MGKAYWLSRKRATLKLAQNAANSEARLVHDLAASLPPAIYAGRSKAIVNDSGDA